MRYVAMLRPLSSADICQIPLPSQLLVRSQWRTWALTPRGVQTSKRPQGTKQIITLQSFLVWICNFCIVLTLPCFPRMYLQFSILNFRLGPNGVCLLLGNSPASEFYIPTFRNTLCSIFIGRFVSKIAYFRDKSSPV